MSNARFSIIQAKAVRDIRVTDAQLRVLTALGMYSDRDGWCFPSQSTLAEDIGKSRQTVNGYVSDLVRLGYLEKHKRFDNSIRYRLLFDTPLVEPALQGLSNEGDTNVPSNVPNTNTSSGENQPSDIPDEYPIEWQIGLGKEKIVMPDNKDNQYRDAANIIAMTFGTNSQLAFSIAYTFMKTRGIIIPTNKLKGNRKAVQTMIQMGVNVEHVEEATRLLMGNKKLTGIVDLFSIEKTASSLANPAPETYGGAIDGV